MNRPRALITRPRPDAEPLADRLAGLGITPVIEPMMEVSVLDGPPLPWAGVQAVALTSANGARALAIRDERRDLPVFAVGEATARTARDLGFSAVESAGGDLETLASLIVRRLDPVAGAIHHVAGLIVAGDLSGRLEAAGFRCERVTLYDARPVPQLTAPTVHMLAENRFSAVLLFSPRTAGLFAGLVNAAGVADACRRLIALCLSDRVAAAAARLVWRQVAVAARPDQEAMIALARNRLRTA